MLWANGTYVHERNGGDPLVFDQTVLREAMKSLMPVGQPDEKIVVVRDQATNTQFDVHFKKVTHVVQRAEPEVYLSNLELGRTVEMMDRELIRRIIELGVGAFGAVTPVRVYVVTKDRMPSHLVVWYVSRVTSGKADAAALRVAQMQAMANSMRASTDRVNKFSQRLFTI